MLPEEARPGSRAARDDPVGREDHSSGCRYHDAPPPSLSLTTMTATPPRLASLSLLLLPALGHAASGSAYTTGRTAGYLVGGLVLFWVAKRLLGDWAWARWLIVPAVAVAILRMNAGPGSMDSAQMQALAATVKADEVVMYSTTDCVYCHQAKAWLQQNGFAFTECNMSVSRSCEQEFRAYKATGTPFLVVRGKRMDDGFDSDQFLELVRS